MATSMNCCPICKRKVQSHALQILCKVCHCLFHMKCLSLESAVLKKLVDDENEWFCSLCISNELPFNHIENDNEFIISVCGVNQSCLERVNMIDNMLTLTSEYENCDFDHFRIDFDPDEIFYK